MIYNKVSIEFFSFCLLHRARARAGGPRRGGWQGGDATPEVGAHVDWAGKTFVREEMQDGLYQAVAELLPGAPILVIIVFFSLSMI